MIIFLLLLSLSHSVVSDSLPPHGLQHPRLSFPSLSPRACSNSCPLSWWCHPTISSPAARFSCHQSFPAPKLFLFFVFFQWVNTSHQVTKVLECQLLHQCVCVPSHVDSLQWVILDSWYPKKIYLQNQGPGSITQELLHSRVLLKWKKTENTSDIDIRRGMESASTH